MSILHTHFLAAQKPLLVKKTLLSCCDDGENVTPCLPQHSRFFIASFDGTATCGITEYHNLATATIIVTKKGKTGKTSVPSAMKVFLPIFWPHDDPEMEKGFLKLLPSDKRILAHTIIASETGNQDCEDIRNFTQADFLGWCAAQSVRIHIADNLLLRGQGQVFLRVMENGSQIERQIIDSLKLLRPPQKRGVGVSDYIKSSLLDNRETTITLVRKTVSELVVGVRRYLYHTLLNVICRAAGFLVFANNNRDYRFTEDDALLERTLRHYEEMLSSMRDVIAQSRFFG